jgi:hypothetical protein
MNNQYAVMNDEIYDHTQIVLSFFYYISFIFNYLFYFFDYLFIF